MYLNKKGKVPNQAHVGIPEGFCEEEHGREGFAGPVSHLYRTHPPTGWVKIEGPLKPRAFACAQLSMTLTPSIAARPILMMQSQDASLFLSILSQHGLYAYVVAGLLAEEAGILLLPTLGETPVLRFAPPLVISDEEIDFGVSVCEREAAGQVVESRWRIDDVDSIGWGKAAGVVDAVRMLVHINPRRCRSFALSHH